MTSEISTFLNSPEQDCLILFKEDISELPDLTQGLQLIINKSIDALLKDVENASNIVGRKIITKVIFTIEK